MSTKKSQSLITVEIASAESGLSPREAWNLIKRHSVPVLGGPKARMGTARFRRADWEAGLVAALRPVVAASDPGSGGKGRGPRNKVAGSKATADGWDKCLDIHKRREPPR